MKNKSLLLTLNILFSIVLFLFILTTNISILINCKMVYTSAISRYNISTVTKMHPDELTKVYSHWIKFFNFEESTPQIVVKNIDTVEFELLSEKEIVHLEDVRKLIKFNYTIQTITTFLVAAIIIVLRLMTKGWKILFKFFLRTGSVLLMIMIACVTFALADFDRLFLLFHEISFNNDFWILDPARDYLIMLFPREFFVDTTMMLLLFIFVELAVVTAIGYLFLRKFKRTHKSHTASTATAGTASGA